MVIADREGADNFERWPRRVQQFIVDAFCQQTIETVDALDPF
jgi:hypothetical protein